MYFDEKKLYLPKVFIKTSIIMFKKTIFFFSFITLFINIDVFAQHTDLETELQKAKEQVNKAREQEQKAIKARKIAEIKVLEAKKQTEMANKARHDAEKQIIEAQKQAKKAREEKRVAILETKNLKEINAEMTSLKDEYGKSFLKYIKGQKLKESELKTIYRYLELQQALNILPTNFETIINEIKTKLDK